MDTFVIIDGDILQYLEIPNSINFGGEQILKVHQLIGGKRIVDAMGAAEADITWSGVFKGTDAEYRARYFDGRRKDGQAVIFTYSQFRYRIIIKSFVANYERFYTIPYQITLSVIEDLTLPIPFIIPTNLDDFITGAMIKAHDLATGIGSGGVTAALTALSAAANLIPSFANASTSQLNGFSSVLTSAQSAVSSATKELSGKLF